jgi:hypothetical protein
MATSPLETLLGHLEEYKRKYYLNLLLKGLIFSAAVLLSAYLIFNTLEYFGRFGSTFRAVLFFGFLAVLTFSLIFWVVKPAWFLYGRRKPLSNEQAAAQIGQFFPEVGDRLLNTLQLARLSTNQNELLLASIQQKSQQLAFVRFADAVQLDENQRYLKYIAAPALLIMGILFVSPAFFAQPTQRIVNFKNEYVEDAPFSFVLENKSLQAFKNEDFTVQLKLQGEVAPEGVFLRTGNRSFRMELQDEGTYVYTFRKIQKDAPFSFEAAGFSSAAYEVEVVQRPALAAFDVRLTYPTYLNKPAESLKNVGNLSLPQGTSVTWQFDAQQTETVLVQFEPSQTRQTAEKSLVGNAFSFQKRAMTSGNYQIFLQNQYAANREPIQYYLNVTPDRHPTISLEQYRDSTLYNFVVLSGSVTDDYGLSQLRVFYKISRQNQPEPKAYASVGLSVNRNQTIQSYYFPWQTDSLRLESGDRLEYYVQVWDNDGVNGAKSARTPILTYAPPAREAVEKELEVESGKAEAQLDKSLSRAQQLKNELAALENRLRSKRELDFQDKKQIEELLKKREQLMEEIRQLQNQNKALTERQQRFNQLSPEAAKKAEQLQRIMDELLNNDTQKLYDQLKNMLEKNQDSRLLELLDRLKNKERNTEKELDRALNLFKKLQVDQKMDQAIEDLKKLSEKQENLADKTEQNKSDAKPEPNKPEQNQQFPENKSESSAEQLRKEQEALEKAMEDIKEKLKAAEEMNKELPNSPELDTQPEQQNEISNQQKQSKQDLSNQNNKAASQKQKKAASQMKQLAQQLADSKNSAEMEETSENMDDLRKILENLIRLSFDQEKVMKEFRGVNLADPRFVKLSQEQLKLQDDAKVVEDSLYALAKRVLQIQSFVTRELSDMRTAMDDGVQYIKERKINQATSKQQFAMTSMNNLALMLSDVLKQMQDSMASMMSMASGKGNQKKGSKPMPGMGEKQQQLNQQMQQMNQQGPGQGGKQYSEQLARLAAEQAALRKQLQELMNQSRGTEAGQKQSSELQDIMKKMDETEEDLVNKRLNQNTVNRNRELLTRLLESEKALKEQEEDQKRKGETARQVPPRIPALLDTFNRVKQRQTELLKTVPPTLSPFYRREVDNYFQKLK